jgi:DNA-binding transcriptional LysR family regulator
MGVIGPMNFAALDLNLLRVFDAMAIELNTTRTGERVGLSQPAVSSALGRLRQILGDELFVREGNRMVPTERALALREPVRQALRQMEDALATVARFDPASATQTFRIAGSDFFSVLLMPRLAAAVLAEAPGVTLQMLDHPSVDAVRLLGEGAIDLALVPVNSAATSDADAKSSMIDAGYPVPDWVCSRKMLDSFMVSVARKGHPVLERAGVKPGHRIPPDVFCAMPQVMMSMDGRMTGIIDPPLADAGLKRRVVMTVPHFQGVVLAIAESGLLGNLPIHFARAVGPSLGLELYLPPYDPPFASAMLFWHRRLDGNGANAWLREHIAKALDFGPPKMTVPLNI